MIYVDTSLLLPVYTPEAQSERANRILESDSFILISDLTVAEFYVGLARKVKLKFLTPRQAEAAGACFETHLAEGLLNRTALHSAHTEAASHLAIRSAIMLRTLDALHLAVAMGLGLDRLATFDNRLADAARGFGLTVLA